MIFDCVILGSGPAGLSAALYVGRAGFSCVLLTGPEEGGKLLLTDKIENYPGFSTGSGLELIETIQKQVLATGISYKKESAVHVSLNSYPFEIQTENTNYQTRSIIIAMGTSVNWLGLPSENKFKGKGISVCATCDGFFYKDKKVAVIGGGNTALYEALHLAQIAEKVTLVVKNKTLKGEKILLDQVLASSKIEIFYQTQVLEFLGQDKLTHLKLQKGGQNNDFLFPVDGCFEAIGFSPTSLLFQKQLKLTPTGYIQTDCQSYETSVKGIYACGDIQQPQHRQAIIAAGSGALAALAVQDFLSSQTYP